MKCHRVRAGRDGKVSSGYPVITQLCQTVFLSFQDRRLVVCLPLTSSFSASWKILNYFSKKYLISSPSCCPFSDILVSAFTPFMKLIVFKTIKTNFRNSLFTNSSYLSRHSFVLIMKEINIFIPIPKLKCQLYLRKSNLWVSQAVSAILITLLAKNKS